VFPVKLCQTDILQLYSKVTIKSTSIKNSGDMKIRRMSEARR